MAYASYEDLVARYPDLPDMTAERAAVKLADASLVIDQAFARRHKSPSNVGADVLRMVCCDIAARVLYPSSMGLGMDVSQFSTTVGAISEQLTFNSSGGNCRLLKSDMDNLGLGTGGLVYLGEEVSDATR